MKRLPLLTDEEFDFLLDALDLRATGCGTNECERARARAIWDRLQQETHDTNMQPSDFVPRKGPHQSPR